MFLKTKATYKSFERKRFTLKENLQVLDVVQKATLLFLELTAINESEFTGPVPDYHTLSQHVI